MAHNGEVSPSKSNELVSVRVDDADVIRLKWTEGIIIDETAARTAWHCVNELSADKRRPMVVDMAETKSVTRRARAVFLDPGAANLIALLGRSPVDRVVANFVLGVTNLPVQTRFFTSEQAAVDWIAAHRT